MEEETLPGLFNLEHMRIANYHNYTWDFDLNFLSIVFNCARHYPGDTDVCSLRSLLDLPIFNCLCVLSVLIEPLCNCSNSFNSRRFWNAITKSDFMNKVKRMSNRRVWKRVNDIRDEALDPFIRMYMKCESATRNVTLFDCIITNTT